MTAAISVAAADPSNRNCQESSAKGNPVSDNTN